MASQSRWRLRCRRPATARTRPGHSPLVMSATSAPATWEFSYRAKVTPARCMLQCPKPFALDRSRGSRPSTRKCADSPLRIRLDDRRERDMGMGRVDLDPTVPRENLGQRLETTLAYDSGGVGPCSSVDGRDAGPKPGSSRPTRALGSSCQQRGELASIDWRSGWRARAPWLERSPQRQVAHVRHWVGGDVETLLASTKAGPPRRSFSRRRNRAATLSHARCCRRRKYTYAIPTDRYWVYSAMQSAAADTHWRRVTAQAARNRYEREPAGLIDVTQRFLRVRSRRVAGSDSVAGSGRWRTCATR